MRVFNRHSFPFLHLRCAHVGACPGLHHMVIFLARKQSFIEHTAYSFCLRWRALKGPICTDVAFKNYGMPPTFFLLVVASKKKWVDATERIITIRVFLLMLVSSRCFALRGLVLVGEVVAATNKWWRWS
jgi:hypothetical protein